MNAPSYRDLRRHPVTQLLSVAALGSMPTEAELEELQLSPADRREVLRAAEVAAALKSKGENAAARREARGAAEEIVSSLSEPQQDPDYLKPPEPHTTDPRELADKVSRGW